MRWCGAPRRVEQYFVVYGILCGPNRAAFIDPGTAFSSREPSTKKMSGRSFVLRTGPRLPEASLTLPETWVRLASRDMFGSRLRRTLEAFCLCSLSRQKFAYYSYGSSHLPAQGTTGPHHGVTRTISPPLVLLTMSQP